MRPIVVLIAILGVGSVSAAVHHRSKAFVDGENGLDENDTKSSYNFRLNITIATPEIVSVPHNGRPLELNCEAYGAPAPSIKWFRNHIPIFEHDLESNEVLSTNPSSLGRLSSTILVPHPRDRDVFTCVASNGFMVEKASSTIFNSEQPDTSERRRLYPLAPRILSTYLAFVDVMGTTVVLPCKVRGHPRPKISWTVNDEPAEDDPRMEVLHSGELVINNLMWKDTGKAVCRAENDYGFTSAETYLYAASG